MTPYVSDRAHFEAASELMTQYGDFAALEATARANRSRNIGNALGFCKWRSIERLIGVLSIIPEDVTLH